MARGSRLQKSQKIKAQAIAANGSAMIKPRPKLRSGGGVRSAGRLRDSGNASLVLIVLSIMVNDLLLLREVGQKAGRFFCTTRRKNIASAPAKRTRDAKASRLAALWNELAAIVSILRLALGTDPDRLRKIDQVIYLGSGQRRKKRLGQVRRAALLIACLIAPRVAFAQEAVNVVTPTDLFDTRTSPGVRVAPSLILQAGADATLDYDSNIYNDETIKRSDTVAILQPSFKLATDLPRHSAALMGTAEIRRYFDTSAENSEQWALNGEGLFDLGSRFSVRGEAGIADKIEPRGTAGDVFNTDEPVRYTQRRIFAQVARTGGTLELLVDGSLTKDEFDNPTQGGVPIDLSFRDVVIRTASIRANYKLSPKVGVYVRLAGNQVDYSIDTAIPRNSSGYTILGGVHYQVSSLVDVEGAVGYIRQNFDDPSVDSAGGIDYQLRANWTPTPRWKLTAAGSRSVDPSPLSNVPAIIRSDFELKAQRAVSDKVLVEARVAYVNEDYRNTARSDQRYIANAAVMFRFSENLGASVHAGYRKQDSAEFDQSYDGVSAGVTVNLTV